MVTVSLRPVDLDVGGERVGIFATTTFFAFGLVTFVDGNLLGLWHGDLGLPEDLVRRGSRRGGNLLRNGLATND